METTPVPMTRARQRTLVQLRFTCTSVTSAAMAGELTALRYRLQWANPLWELAGLDPAQEEQQILKRLVQAAGAVRPAVAEAAFSDQALLSLATTVELPPRWRLLHSVLSAAATALNLAAAAGASPWLGAIIAVVACKGASAAHSTAPVGAGVMGAAPAGSAAGGDAAASSGALAEAEAEGFLLIEADGCA